MNYFKFMITVNEISKLDLAISEVITEVKKFAKDYGIKIKNDLEAIELIEISKKYEVNYI